MKKIVAVLLILILLAGGGVGAYYFYFNDEVFTYADAKVTLPEAMVYAKVQQSNAEGQYGSYLGEDMWNLEMKKGVTLQDSVKEEVIKQIKAVKVLNAHAKDVNVSLSSQEKATAKEKAKTFKDSELGKRVLEQSKADDALLDQIYLENALANKVHEVLMAKADTKIKDEDAKVTSVYKLVFATKKTDKNGKEVTLSKEEDKKQKSKAKKAYKQLKKGADIGFLAKQYDVKDTAEESYGRGKSVEGTVFEAEVAKLKEGEFTKVIKTDTGYVVAKLLKENDTEKMEENKKTILAERQQQAYEKQYEAWAKAEEAKWSDSSIKQRLWNKVTFTYGK